MLRKRRANNVAGGLKEANITRDSCSLLLLRRRHRKNETIVLVKATHDRISKPIAFNWPDPDRAEREEQIRNTRSFSSCLGLISVVI